MSFYELKWGGSVLRHFFYKKGLPGVDDLTLANGGNSGKYSSVFGGSFVGSLVVVLLTLILF